MAVLQLLGELVDFLGGVGPVLFGIVLLLVTPYVDRLLVRRKRISFRVLYNSKIGLGPESYKPAKSDPPQLRRLTTLLERMSIVVIRIRNSGSYDIDEGDFDRPLAFTFGGRVVWNARVSEASTDPLRTRLRDGLRFFTTASKPSPDSLQTVRGRLGSGWRAGCSAARPSRTPPSRPGTASGWRVSRSSGASAPSSSSSCARRRRTRPRSPRWSSTPASSRTPA
ncbi:hypothetical protein ACFQYP_12000 [Nonomuraea antimicrobica]